MPELTPSAELFLLVLIFVLGLGFDFINGFHDTANAIATVVATRVLSPGRAVLMAGVLNFVGALSGTAVATTVGKGIIPPEVSTQTLVISALLAAIVWNLVTWYFGLPSSSSHALIFSLVGAGVAGTGWNVIQVGGVGKTFPGLGFSPLPRHRDPRLRSRTTPVGGVHGLLARLQRRAEDDGRDDHGPRQLSALGRQRLAGARLDHRRRGDRHGPGDLDRWLAHHPHHGPARRRAAPHPRLCRRNRRRHGHRSRQSARRARVDHAHHRLGHPGRWLDPPPVRGPLGDRRPDRHGLDPDDSRLLPDR